ncbi:MAG: hypothetical protein A6F71_06950 [Cycloclasticus sp. symbiont of Poecilosclerida sp. M]|nr:MAG: hypothetical protein A6F71_06950 [Cycloclasticus sp. symbiont of Poecilosclerida sp. M]
MKFKEAYSHLYTRLSLSCFLLLLTGCSSLDLLNAVTPDGNSKLQTNISYGSQRRQTLDIHVPSTLRESTPVIIFIYGGRWQSGTKEEYQFVGQALAKRGIMTVVPDYRLFPEVEFPEFISDTAKVTQWTLNNIEQYGGDPSQVHLMGHSAGAHIVAMLATNKTYLTEHAASLEQIKGVIGLSGGYDFKITDPDIKQVFRKAKDYPSTQPISFVDGSEPPLLLLHGKKDVTLSPTNSLNLATKVNELGGHAEYIIYDDMAHVGILLSLANNPMMYFPPLLDDIEKFVFCGTSRIKTVSNCS